MSKASRGRRQSDCSNPTVARICQASLHHAILPRTARNRLLIHVESSSVEDERVLHDLRVNGKTITLLHRDELLAGSVEKSSRIREIEFFELADVDDVGAIGWRAHHDFVRSLPANLDVRGLRARIGDLSNLFEDSYEETLFMGTL